MNRNETVLVNRVTSREDYYYVALRMLEQDATRIFLMQRSSSIVLGPEDGWPGEAHFYDCLLARIRDGVEFLHVVNLEGVCKSPPRPNLRAALRTQAARWVPSSEV